MDAASFRMAFQRFQNVRGDCVYLRSDQGSNFMATRNDSNEIDQNAFTEIQNIWEKQGKIWDVNPPLASHFGGVWERKIGQMRRLIEAHMLSEENKTMDKEQFTTMLLHAASIVNSTPLWDPPSDFFSCWRLWKGNFLRNFCVFFGDFGGRK